MNLWNDTKNDRRCELIDKEIEGTILPAEQRDLEELQRQMLAYRRKFAPLPRIAKRLAGQERVMTQAERIEREEDEPVADFFEPVTFDWDNDVYEARLAVREYSADTEAS